MGGENDLKKTILSVLAIISIVAFAIYSFNATLMLQSTTKRESTVITVEVHCWVAHYRNGVLLSISHHAGNLTDAGKEWIEQQVSGTSNTTQGKYISCTNTLGTYAATWTNIPDEITSNGFNRAAGTYASTGTGAWNVSKTFTSSGTQSVQRYGLSYQSAENGGGLICTDTSTQKNTVSGDTVAVTFQVTVT